MPNQLELRDSVIQQLWKPIYTGIIIMLNFLSGSIFQIIRRALTQHQMCDLLYEATKIRNADYRHLCLEKVLAVDTEGKRSTVQRTRKVRDPLWSVDINKYSRTRLPAATSIPTLSGPSGTSGSPGHQISLGICSFRGEQS